MLSIHNKSDFSSQNFLDRIKELLITNTGKRVLMSINSEFNEMISNAKKSVLKGNFELLTVIVEYHDYVSVIENTCKYCKTMLEKANIVISNFEDVISIDSSKRKLELPVISNLKDSIEKNNNVFIEVKANFDKYMAKLPDEIKKIVEFENECKSARISILKEVAQDKFDPLSIKNTLNKLDLKFEAVIPHLNENNIVFIEQEIDKGEGILYDIFSFVNIAVEESIDNISKCLNDVLQDNTYIAIVNYTEIVSEKTTTPPTQEPNSFIACKKDEKLADNVDSPFSDKKDENNTVHSSHTNFCM